MTKKIYAGLLPAVITSLLLAAGCSDNYDLLYKPVGEKLTLTATPASDNFSDSNHTLALAASPSTTTVTVESNTSWEVKITYNNAEESQGWCTTSAYSGSGDGAFDISVLENLVDERKCTVTVSSVDSHGEALTDGVSSQFNITQNSSNVRLSPSEVEPFTAGDPRSESFSIIANDDIEWTLALSYEEQSGGQTSEFMHISNMNGADVSQDDNGGYSGMGNASFTLTLDANRINAARIGFITLQSGVGTYTVEIRQLAAEYTFDVSLDDYRAIPASGGTLQFGVYSPLIGWEVQGVPTWVSFSPANGEASGDRITVTATVEPTPTGIDRSATVAFVPQGENADLYPKVDVQIVQSGSEDLAMSAPWLTGDIGQTSLTLRFNYYSMTKPVAAAGIQWKENDGNVTDGWQNAEDTAVVVGSGSGFVTVALTGLKAATDYVARGYLVFEDGQTKYGPVSNPPFTTAGTRPGSGDNPTPGI